jgi:hypothetical protein
MVDTWHVSFHGRKQHKNTELSIPLFEGPKTPCTLDCTASAIGYHTYFVIIL